ncbi:MAG TPA: sigma-70 family RNA polymerase sigma factor [Acidobacteriota bacterium]|nr:sigma-70 family RNA polymerase sigma factor [Acidobacteriota bacterium]
MSTAAADLFSRLYRTWAPRIFNHFRRLSWSTEDASDLTAEVFAVAWDKRAEVRDQTRIGGWLWSIARRQAANRVRGETRRQQREETAGIEAAGESTGDGTRHRVRRAFAALDEDDRQLLLWREHSGLTYKEIAELTSGSEDSVRASLYRARVRLREEFKKRWE